MFKQGRRTTNLILTFLVATTTLGILTILRAPSQLPGLATVITAMGAGAAAVKFGNAAEGRSERSGNPPAGGGGNG